MPLLDALLVKEFTDAGWWGSDTLSHLVRSHAASSPEGLAYITSQRRTTWSDYDREADAFASALLELGAQPGERAAVLLPDSEVVHAALLGTERAGVVAAGLGWRAGIAEIAHLVRRTGATFLVTMEERKGTPVQALVNQLQEQGLELDGLVVVHDGLPRAQPLTRRTAREAQTPLGPNDLYLLNSTSGTTGMPKVVTQFQNRWLRFVQHAIDCGNLKGDETFMSVIPAPFGFGLWTSHFAPTVLKAPAVVQPTFDVDEVVRLIEQEQVTVLCCVSTQFRMLLNAPRSLAADLSSLRVMFTGGEMIPPDRAAEFEERTGAVVLSFFGSNESGAFTATRYDDPPDKRLTTVGRALPDMHLRLYDEDGRDITSSGGPGIPGGHGPLACAGYYDDPEANSKLYAPDGAMLMGDLVTIDAEGYVQVVGRTSDIIIRGGKNISALQVETEVDSHPAVDQVAVVPVRDEVFGERVCAVVTLTDGSTLTLDDLSAHLLARGLGRELLPEHLLVLDDLPRSSGGKLAKGQLRTIAEERLL
ncbi:MAG: putative acyl-CoA ligase/synthetase [Frankiales bacterium]|nr:putative acyl-CoA ligase/synthetase [Frankiales bacterium]